MGRLEADLHIGLHGSLHVSLESASSGAGVGIQSWVRLTAGGGGFRNAAREGNGKCPWSRRAHPRALAGVSAHVLNQIDRVVMIGSNYKAQKARG